VVVTQGYYLNKETESGKEKKKKRRLEVVDKISMLSSSDTKRKQEEKSVLCVRISDAILKLATSYRSCQTRCFAFIFLVRDK